MTEQIKTSDLASRLLSRKKKVSSTEKSLPGNTKLRSFDLRQEVETVYQEALTHFKSALETMPEWLDWEKARKQWTDLHDKESARIRHEALKAYTKACEELPEWQAYFAALKRRDDVMRWGIMR
jgi:hypothetical protein